MENGLYKNYKLTKFYEIYNTNKSELIKDNHIYFRYLCFKYIDFIKHVKIPNFLENSDYESVLVEYRCFPHIEFLIRNTIIKLGKKWSHTVVCGNLNYDFVKNICKNISKKIKVIKTDYDNLTPSEYSKLLTSNYFWDLFNGDKLLIYQEDSCIFKNNIDDFIHWDYIGAPFAKTTNDTPNCVGNGGLSLRTKNTMKKIIEFISVNDTNFNYSTIQYMKNMNLNFPPEDVYFSKNMQEFNVGKVANWNSAYEFSSESINNNNSFGGHKFWICNNKWKKIIKDLYNIKNYQFNNDIIKYLKFTNKSESLDLTKKNKNAFDIDLYFCNIVNNLGYKNENEILKYIKETGLNGYIYHPQQILNIFPTVDFYNCMDNIYISYKFDLYNAKTFVNDFLYDKTFDELRNVIIKKKFEKVYNKYDLLILAFIGNNDVGLDLINKIIKYKNIQKFNIAFCFNSNEVCNHFKSIIKDNFHYYFIYLSKNLGTDITSTMLMYDDIRKKYNFKHIIKLHTKSITNAYNELTDYLLNVPLEKLLLKKRQNSHCIGHHNYYIKIKDDVFNKQLVVNHLHNILINHTFVGGTIFYSSGSVIDCVVNFIKQNNYRAYLLNNLYENNSINIDFSPIHFLERLFGIINTNNFSMI